ncbi:MAG: glycosyltransferase [Bacteroidales bacterium]|nr:glycosyltransferase [Bacteroidales bacterium]
MNNVVVTIICLTYNHEKWIGDALEGFIRQEAPFDYEVLVHDDASDDRTPQIIAEYAEKYPDVIIPFYEKENQMSKGVVISKEILYPHIRGKYVALCEGDDCWTDPDKLKKQVEAMENHPDVDICAHTVLRIGRKGLRTFIAPAIRDTVIPVEKVILGGGAFVATCSLMCRAESYMEESPVREIIYNDYSLQIQGSLRGGMLFLKDCMGLYRQGLPASWTGSHHGKERILQRKKDRLMLKALDDWTGGRYSEEIDLRMRLYDSDDLITEHKYLSLLKPSEIKVTCYQLRRTIAKFRNSILIKL